MKFEGKIIKGMFSVSIVLVFMVSSLALLIPNAEEAEGWSSHYSYADSNPYGTYVSASRIERYDRAQEGTIFGSSLGCGRMGYYNYRPFISFYIGNLDEDAYIHSGSVSVYVYYYSYSFTLRAYLMGAGTYTNYDFDDLSAGRYLGSNDITTTSRYTYSLDSTDISLIRQAVKKGEDWYNIGFRFYETSSSSSISRTCYISSTSSSYLSLNKDSSAPQTPVLDDLDDFNDGTSVSLDWNPVSDRPTGGSYGNVRYQAGVFDNKSSSEPIHTSPWSSSTEYTFNSLTDGEEYHFRARAKDGLGYTSVWSSVRSTTIDSEPPTTPALLSEPTYTEGSENRIIWNPSTDTASGIQYYAVFAADNPDMVGAVGAGTTDNFYTFTGLDSGKTYYYVVYAVDNMDHTSQLSPMEKSMQDYTEPSVPIMMPEPTYTKGIKNRYDWHSSNDIGIGVSNYTYEVATSEDFNPGSIVDHGTVSDTFFVTDGLVDGTRYWARVRARDAFGHESDWSRAEWSIQDESGPGDLGVSPLMTYSPDEPIRLEWNGAEDGGTGTGWYKVQWSLDPLFGTDVEEIDHVVGHSYTISGLDTGETWYFRVKSYDGLGNEGENETVLTTIDPDPPTAPEISEMSEFTGGRTCMVDWSESTDDISGLDHYVLNVYTTQERVGLAFTVHTTETEFEVPGLSDGTTYYYEVVAIDRAGNRIESALKHSMQDAKGPNAPIMKGTVGEYHTEGIVPISWEASEDEGMGGVTYEVQYAINSLFTEGVRSFTTTDTNDHLHFVSDTRADPSSYTPLADGKYYYHVRALDSFGTPSAYSQAFSVVIDTEDPETPEMEDTNQFWGGGKATVEWDDVEDDASYRVMVFDNETVEEPVMESPWMNSLEYEIMGLDGGKQYFIRVMARDLSGRISETSEPVSIFIDNTPPRLTINKNGIFGGSDAYISGEAEDRQTGMGEVQISFDEGLSWENVDLDDEVWSYPISGVPPDENTFMVRAIDDGGNIGDSIHGSIDLNEPQIQITYPGDGDEVSGAVQLMGSISDMNLKNYMVEYKGPSGDWEEVLPMQTTSGFSGILGTWITSGLPGGEYTIKVTAEDQLGQTVSEEISLVLVGANIVLDPTMVTFSNPQPSSGDTVTVFLTVTNLGDSPAEDVTVTLFDDEEPIGSENGVTIPAKGTVVVTGEVEASGTHEITASVSSDTVGDIEMENPAVLETVEDEMIMENFGGILALIAIILAIMAIVLAFVIGGRKGKKEETEQNVQPKDAEIRGRTQEKIEDTNRAPALGQSTGSVQREELPASNRKQETQQPALPNPSVAPASMPQEETPQYQAPPMQEPAKQDQNMTYVPPNHK